MSTRTFLRKTGLGGTVLVAAAIAILTHAALPSDLEGVPFSGVLIDTVGFEVVAVGYFLLVFSHCAWVVAQFGPGLNLPWLKTGFRIGLSFALLYMLGMQEVVVEASPFASWGTGFVWFQLLMGLGDGLAVTVLCLQAARILFSGRNQGNKSPLFLRPDRWTMILVTLLFFIQRIIRMTGNLIDHNLDRYPVQTVVWTLLFGMALGFACSQLRSESWELNVWQAFRTGILAVGLNWMIYNSFIGMIFEATMVPMLLRSGIDAVVLTLSLVLAASVKRVLTDRLPDGQSGECQ